MNPLLPASICVPDVEARVWSDGSIYLYGSLDVPGDSAFCSQEYRVFSSTDLNAWTDHGRSLSTSCITAGGFDLTRALYAPDAIFLDGKYHVIFCQSGGRIGVASSPHPTGPFENARPIKGADRDGIDPAVLVDDDGEVYLYWGQYELRAAKLRRDLSAILPETENRKLLVEASDGFHEGACIRKIGNNYYLIYTDTSRGKATSLAYATSIHPLGPFEKRGIIVDNDGCDPATWNNHGSIIKFQGQWIVFYHRSSEHSKYSRRVCAERIAILPDGTIPEVEMTTQGLGEPLATTQEIEAGRACRVTGKVGVTWSEDDTSHGTLKLAGMHDGSWAEYKYIAFTGRETRIRVVYSSASQGGLLEVRRDSPTGPLLGSLTLAHTGGWTKWNAAETALASTEQTAAVYLVPKGFRGRLFDLKSFTFV